MDRIQQKRDGKPKGDASSDVTVKPLDAAIPDAAAGMAAIEQAEAAAKKAAKEAKKKASEQAKAKQQARRSSCCGCCW